MWPFTSTPTASTSGSGSTDVPPSACPVDHSTREAWLAANAGASHPSGPSRPGQAPLSNERQVSSIPRWTKEPVPPTESDKWVYPSPAGFFSALERKNRSPSAEDMPVVVPIHNAVNERVWEQVLEWEREAGAQEGGSKLVSFVGRPKDLSPRARWKSLIGYTAPFDRHDWIIDRTLPPSPSSEPSTEPQSVRIRYVIDFYTGRAAHLLLPPDMQGSPQHAGVENNFRPNLAFYIDCRPAWDGREEVRMRWGRWLKGWGVGGEK